MKARAAIRAALTAVVAGSALVGAPTAAHAAPGDGWTAWSNLIPCGALYCMHMAASGSARGSAVVQQQASCNNDACTDWWPYENWLNTYEGGGAQSFRNAATSGWMALAVPNARKDKGAPIIIWTYEKGHKEQQWRPVHMAHDAVGYVHFQNVNSGLCLAVPGASRSQGVGLIQWTCEDGHIEQQWVAQDA